jgi:glycosyltransferase involved in cell wall biosynthesis
MKIFYVGNTESPFVKMDIKMLGENNHDITVFEDCKKFLQFPIYLIRCLTAAPKIVDSDIIYIWFADVPALPIMLIAKLSDRPIIVWVGEYELRNVPEIEYGNQRSFFRGAVTRWVLRNATKVIVPSPQYIDVVKKVEPFSVEVCVIPWCVDKKEFGEPIEKKDLVVSASFSKGSNLRKGIYHFIIAAKDIPHKIIQGLSREDYIKTIKEAKVYCQFTKPPLESFGVSLLEAMQYGAVPVITPCPAMEWVVGDNGLVVPFGDLKAMREAIIKAKTMDGSFAIKRANEFSYEKRLKTLNDVLQKATED